MRIGAGLDARLGLRFDELRQAGREADRLGFESLWTPAGGVPDAFHLCAAWSQDSTLRTGISVVPAARMWRPLALATQAATVGLISNGRFVLGIGTGGYGPEFWASVDLPDRPIAVMRDYLTILRGLLAGETVNHEGPALRVRSASLDIPGLPRVPVFLGALGSQMVRLAGELADGALLNWATVDRIAKSRSLVKEGADRIGRDPAEVSLTMYIRVCIDDDVEAARRALAVQEPRCTQGIGGFSPRWDSVRSSPSSSKDRSPARAWVPWLRRPRTSFSPRSATSGRLKEQPRPTPASRRVSTRRWYES